MFYIQCQSLMFPTVWVPSVTLALFPPVSSSLCPFSSFSPSPFCFLQSDWVLFLCSYSLLFPTVWAPSVPLFLFPPVSYGLSPFCYFSPIPSCFLQSESLMFLQPLSLLFPSFLVPLVSALVPFIQSHFFCLIQSQSLFSPLSFALY